ncbi:MAG: hypothetical protein WC314_04685 [Vulcanimicrobiota bacterium]
MKEELDLTENPKDFTKLFVFALLVDLVAHMVAASGDEAFEHLVFLWSGPGDDLLYGITSIYAFCYLVNPATGMSGFGTMKKAGVEKQFARNFFRGSQYTFFCLAGLLLLGLIGAFLAPHPVSKGAVASFHQHLSLVFPVSLALITGLTFLRIGESNSTLWKGALAAGASLFLATAIDGRWHNQIYHLLANLENVLAWTVTISWVGFFAAKTEWRAQIIRVPSRTTSL